MVHAFVLTYFVPSGQLLKHTQTSFYLTFGFSGLPLLQKYLSMTYFRGALNLYIALGNSSDRSLWTMSLLHRLISSAMSVLLPLPGSFPKQAISSSEYKFVGGRGD